MAKPTTDRNALGLDMAVPLEARFAEPKTVVRSDDPRAYIKDRVYEATISIHCGGDVISVNTIQTTGAKLSGEAKEMVLEAVGKVERAWRRELGAARP